MRPVEVNGVVIQHACVTKLGPFLKAFALLSNMFTNSCFLAPSSLSNKTPCMNSQHMEFCKQHLSVDPIGGLDLREINSCCKALRGLLVVRIALFLSSLVSGLVRPLIYGKTAKPCYGFGGSIHLKNIPTHSFWGWSSFRRWFLLQDV